MKDKILPIIVGLILVAIAAAFLYLSIRLYGLK